MRKFFLSGGNDDAAEAARQAAAATEAADAAAAAEAEAAKVDPAVAGLQAGIAAEREKRQKAEAKLKEHTDAQAAAAVEAAKKRGEFEELHTAAQARVVELEAQVAAADARETERVKVLTERNTERVEALPDALKALAPDLAPDALSTWLDKAAEAAGDDGLPKGTRSRGGGVPGKVPPEAAAEVARLAAKWGVEPERAWLRLPASLRAVALKGERVNL